MRRSFAQCAVGLVFALWLLVGDTSQLHANAALGAPSRNVPSMNALAAQVETEGGERGEQSSRPVSLDAARERVADTEVALELATRQKREDDRRLNDTALGVEEIRNEARSIADNTVRSAVSAYRHNRVDESVFEISDLNSGLRANTLSDAALLADTDLYNRYYTKQRDLDLAETNLIVRTEINEELASRMADLQESLDVEHDWLAQMEERNIQELARRDSVKAATWAQNRGRKVGFYLLTCPVNGPHNFIDSWGFPRSGGRRHKGVDIMANSGVEVVAPVSGRVEHRSNRVGGLSFHLWDDFGNYFYGTHLSAYGKSGEVKAGEVIGYVGDSGNAAGLPHLHFEIHAGRRGNQINPYLDSAAVCSGARGR